jgi:hypothetical protein
MGERRKVMYLSGPISGMGGLQVRRAFSEARDHAWKHGFKVVDPTLIDPREHDGACPPGRTGMGGHNEACHFRSDIKALVECDAILLLPGWVHSWGVRLELQIATTIGLEVWEQMASGSIYPLAWDNV